MEGAKGVLFNITGGSSLTLFEVNAAAEVIKQAVDPNANVIFGVALEENMNQEVRLVLIATGFEGMYSLGSASREKEITKVLKNLKTEDQLDTPSFLRQRELPKVRQMPVETRR
jgi:cell division protein FtsZ